MSLTTAEKKTNKKNKSSKFDQLIGPMDPKIDYEARERIITARVGLLLKHSFFGNLATRLKLTNADDWLSTAAVDGVRLFYNSRFIMMLKPKEVEFLVAHEIMHLAYDHLSRRDNRDPQMWNIADDYAVNADLKKHRVGEFITTVPCLYEKKYEGMAAEEIYDDLMKNAKSISMDDLLDKLLDEHLEDSDSDDSDGDDGDTKQGKGRPKMSQEEREAARQEMKQAIINAASTADPGSLPAGIDRMIRELTDPVMPWRELIQTNLTSAIKSDYSWARPSRRSWHMDAIMPGMTPGEEIDVTIALDMSGSISAKQAQGFLSEIAGMMDAFDGYKVRVFSFDTKVYNDQVFTSENLDEIGEYVPVGGGGTDFACIFDYLKQEAIMPVRLIVFTDMYCYNWGDPDYCDTTWIGFGNCKDITPPFGTWAYFDDYEK